VGTEWRPVSRVYQGDTSTVQAETITDQQIANEEEGFTPVPKRDTTKQPRQSAGQATPKTGNPFQALDTAEKEALEFRGEGILSHG